MALRGMTTTGSEGAYVGAGHRLAVYSRCFEWVRKKIIGLVHLTFESPSSCELFPSHSPTIRQKILSAEET